MYRAQKTSHPANIVKFPRLRRGHFFADLRQNLNSNPSVYHCVIQRDGCADILCWMQYHSLDDAVKTAFAELGYLARNSAQRAA